MVQGLVERTTSGHQDTVKLTRHLPVSAWCHTAAGRPPALQAAAARTSGAALMSSRCA